MRTAEEIRLANNLKTAKWRAANRDKHRQSHSNWLARNREQMREKWRQRKKNNPAQNAAYESQRRARIVNATPKWLTGEQRAQIISLFEQAQFMSRMTGVRYHVDHIQPLRGADRTGLHVPWNLRVIEAAANLRKKNKAPEMVA